MAENLNYKVSDSYCYGDWSENDGFGNCAIYGRMYNWTGAMALPNSCDRNDCSEQINSPHQGNCPNGWHIPTDEEWGVLMEAVEPTCTNHGATCTGAGVKLKATNGWNNRTDGNSGNGTDDYGFAGVASGRISQDVFEDVNRNGLWWTATARVDLSNSDAYFRSVTYNNDNVLRSVNGRTYWYAVRCVKD
jgi:uncharacterized protein (TIGR02145 family)